MQMAPLTTPNIYFTFSIVGFLSCFAMFCSCDSFNESLVFQPAVATWYGPALGAGTGGGCGFGDDDVRNPPYSSLTAAGNNALYQGGKGCGACYQVRCTQHPACSGAPIRVTITNQCPGACNNEHVHFDLSGAAFGFLAKTGQANTIRNLGRVNVDYQRVPCSYGTPIVFRVGGRANRFYFATAVEYENGDGDIWSLEIQPAGSNRWFPMQQVFGGKYKFNIPSGTRGPYSIKITTIESRRSVVATNVIPAYWAPGKYYHSNVNF